MQYCVKVKEINYGSIELDAANKEEAEEKAETEYYNGNTFWGNADFEIMSVEDTPSGKGQ